QLLKDGFVVNTILKEADLFCPNSVRINFTIYHKTTLQPQADLRSTIIWGPITFFKSVSASLGIMPD
ncbi:hypothetical protein EFR28_04470, partial [Latilactobacillus curvatus]|uniref:hypothetical protein n=1 Tax=Latilactobacillus curvatus TaxID=28038 RepID=UPI0021A37D59